MISALSLIALICLVCLVLSIIITYKNLASESFTCGSNYKNKELQLIHEFENNDEDMKDVSDRLKESPYPFQWEQVFTKQNIEKSTILRSQKNIQAYDWTFIKSLLNKRLTDKNLKEGQSCTKSPYLSSTDLSYPVNEFDGVHGYEKDAKFVEVFSKNRENIVLLDTNFNLLNSSESDVISKTYKDDQVVANDVDGSYSKIDEEGSGFLPNFFEKPLDFRCQRFYQNCQDKLRSYY